MPDSELEFVPAEAEKPVPTQQESPDTLKAIIDAARDTRLENLRTRHEEAVKKGGPEGDIKHIEAQIKAALGSEEENESGGVKIASESDGGKEESGEVPDLQETEKLVAGLLKGGIKPEDPLIATLLNERHIPKENQAEFLRVVQENMAEAKGREPKPAAMEAERTKIVPVEFEGDGKDFRPGQRFDDGTNKGVIDHIEFPNTFPGSERKGKIFLELDAPSK